MATLQSRLILSLVDKISAPAAGIGGTLRRLDAQVDRLNRSHMAVMGGGMVGRMVAYGGAYVGVTQGIEGTVGAALTFESAMADVRKVLEVNDEQFGNIRNQIRAMSREMPVTAEGFAAIYAAAAQANVPMQELTQFSKIVAQTSVAWDVGQGAAGEALAKIKTQLNMSVADIGKYADALNHLSNISAANAPDLIDYSQRVAGTGEMYGFTAEQALAYGSTMIAMGGEVEVAATSFRNMGKALTRGAGTKAEALRGWRRIGMDPKTVAKAMQKDAAKTTMMVLEAVQNVADHERPDIAMALFGEEARALMPVINNATELRRQLAEIGDESRYAGSSTKEFIKRAETVGNVLDIFRNKVRDVFRETGSSWLHPIKQTALGIGDVLDTLDQRAGVFDKIGASVRGFTQGLGYDGGLREVMNDIGDVLFGKANGGGAADQLGAIFVKSKEWGASIRELNAAIQASPISGFMASMGTHGASLAIAGLGITIVAAAISRLAAALYLLTGAKAAVGILKAIGKGGQWVANATKIGGGAAQIEKVVETAKTRLPKRPVTPTPAAPTTPKPTAEPWQLKGRSTNIPTAIETTTEALKGAKWVSGILKGAAAAVATAVGEGAINDVFRAFGKNPDIETAQRQAGAADALGISLAEYQKQYGLGPDNASSLIDGIEAIGNWIKSVAPELARPVGELGPQTGLPSADGVMPVRIVNPFAEGVHTVPTGDWRAPGYEAPRTRGGESDVRPMPNKDIAAELRTMTLQTRQQGTADVNVTNMVRPNVNISTSVSVNVTSMADPSSIGSAVANQVGEANRVAVESAFTDSGV